jgi:hypothetical protein
VSERQEKGLGPIGFKRLLLAGGVGAMGTMLFTRISISHAALFFVSSNRIVG